MFGQWLQKASTVLGQPGSEQLELAMRSELTFADDETVLVTTAIVGLLGAVAYADSDYSDAEQQHVREQLTRIAGITTRGIDSICKALKFHIRNIAATQTPHYCRLLRELADQELRYQILEMLVALAAADQRITSAETNVLRQLTTALGLTQSDYNSVQSKYLEHLAVLKPGP